MLWAIKPVFIICTLAFLTIIVKASLCIWLQVNDTHTCRITFFVSLTLNAAKVSFICSSCLPNDQVTKSTTQYNSICILALTDAIFKHSNIKTHFELSARAWLKKMDSGRLLDQVTIESWIRLIWPPCIYFISHIIHVTQAPVYMSPIHVTHTCHPSTC